MKKIIDGVEYNTETAQKIGHYDNGLPQSDFYFIDVDLYRTQEGKFFIAGEGGRLILGRMASGRGYFRYNEGLVPLTEEESRGWTQYLNYKEEEMKVFDIFKSEGGYRVCGDIWNGAPVLAQSPWFKTLVEAEKGRDAMKARRLEADALECVFSGIPEHFYSPEVRKRAEEIVKSIKG